VLTLKRNGQSGSGLTPGLTLQWRDAAETLVNQGVDVLAYHTGTHSIMQVAQERGVWAIASAATRPKLEIGFSYSAISGDASLGKYACLSR
jgi:hypothetical protein